MTQIGYSDKKTIFLFHLTLTLSRWESGRDGYSCNSYLA